MPYSLQLTTTPSGLRITRLVTSGAIAPAQAKELMQQISPGGSHYGFPMLVISDETVEVTAEARKIFSARLGDEVGPPAAIVTVSQVMRVTINFISRVSGTTNMKMFSTEADAVKWLDATCAPREGSAA